MKKKSIAAVLLTLCLLTGCSSAPEKENSEAIVKATESSAQATENVKGAAAETTEVTTEAPSDGERKEPEIIDVSESEKNIFFYRDNMKISGKLYLPEGEGTFPAVILSGGLYESYKSTAIRAEKFADNGIAGIVFDFTGTGDSSKSDGARKDLTVLTETDDLNVVFDGISSLPEIKSDNVFLWGHSVGGLVSTYVSEQRPDDVKGLILLEPSYQMQDQCKAQYPEGSQIPDNEDKSFTEAVLSLDIYEKMAEYKHNVILFSGTTSQSIGGTTPEYFKRAAETFPSMKEEVIEGADHRFMNLSDDAAAQMMEKMINFINENID